MRHAHILHAFYAEPWHLRSEYWRNFEALLRAEIAGRDIPAPERQPARRLVPAARQSDFVSDLAGPARPIIGPTYSDGEPIIAQMEVFGPVAIIPVYGVLGKRLQMLDLACGGCDYTYISAFTQAALADPAIHAVIFDFDSPGGMSAGCMECAEDIARLTAAKKLTIAYTSGNCCSAAYWLASQCSQLIASRTAIIGNVGTIMAGMDTSGAWEKEGLKLELFVSSPLKATGQDGKAWTDADRAYLQERMQQADDRIKSAVRTGRPQTAPAALDGRWFWAENSLSLGVCDDLAPDLDTVLLEVLRAISAAPAL